jgi:hypothetical protein
METVPITEAKARIAELPQRNRRAGQLVQRHPAENVESRKEKEGQADSR